MIRRIIFKPSRFAIMRTRSISKYQQYKATPKMRGEITVKPNDSLSSQLYLIRHQNSTAISSPTLNTSNDTTSVWLQKKDLDDNDKLNVDLYAFVVDQSEFFRLEIFPFSLDTTKQKDTVILKKGNTEIEITSRISKDPDVKFRDTDELCGKEEEFVTKRRSVVFQNMKKIPAFETSLMETDESKIPNIAIIGSGGGMRALIGFSACLFHLQMQGIYDCALYVAGVSGSSWLITMMYADFRILPPSPTGVAGSVFGSQLPYVKASGLLNNIKGHLSSMNVFDRSCNNRYWRNFNLTTEFGISLNDIFLVSLTGRDKWSEKAYLCENGNYPLPLLAALHVRAEMGTNDYNEWIELSPYEVAIPNYGAAIDMENFGDEFYGGFITKELGERPIPFLQGMCGSAHAYVRDKMLSEWSSSVFISWIRAFFNVFDQTLFGTVPNWLYGIAALDPLFDDIDPKKNIIDTETKSMLVIDAGIAINSPYPTVLRPSRKVDIIISFDFTDREKDEKWPFEELEKASDWAKKREIPFPEIHSQLEEIKDKCSTDGSYEEIYIFPGDDISPTIVHFVMTNNMCCKNGGQDFDIHQEYSSFRFSYTVDELFRLWFMCAGNVFKNKETLYDCILSAIEKKKSMK